MSGRLTHLDERGQAVMVDVGSKPATLRTAVASGCVSVGPEAYRPAGSGELPKGDLLAAARVAGILAAKVAVTCPLWLMEKTGGKSGHFRR